jgi:hypothetical protein
METTETHDNNILVRHPGLEWAGTVTSIIFFVAAVLAFCTLWWSMIGPWLTRFVLVGIGLLRGLINLAFGSGISAKGALLYDVSAEPAPPGGPYDFFTIADSIASSPNNANVRRMDAQ